MSQSLKSGGFFVHTQWLEYSFGILGALLVLMLITLTSVDVIARFFFNAPLKGAFELTELLVSALVFVALPLVTDREEHVAVDWLSQSFSNRMQLFIHALSGWLIALVLVVFAWLLWHRAEHFAATQTVTHALAIPLHPLAYIASLCCFCSAMLSILQSFSQSAP